MGPSAADAPQGRRKNENPKQAPGVLEGAAKGNAAASSAMKSVSVCRKRAAAAKDALKLGHGKREAIMHDAANKKRRISSTRPHSHFGPAAGAGALTTFEFGLQKGRLSSNCPHSRLGKNVLPPRASVNHDQGPGSQSSSDRQVPLLNCLTLLLQEGSMILKRHVEVESFTGFCAELSSFRKAVRRLLKDVDRGVHSLREKELERSLQAAEKDPMQCAAAAEQDTTVLEQAPPETLESKTMDCAKGECTDQLERSTACSLVQAKDGPEANEKEISQNAQVIGSLSSEGVVMGSCLGKEPSFP